MDDSIRIENLELMAHVGVPDEERAEPQRLTVSLTLIPKNGLTNLNDRIEKTVDYFAVSEFVKALAAARPRRLIETLAEEIANGVLEKFAPAAVEIELRKFILSDTEFVAIRLRRISSRGKTPIALKRISPLL